ncbi:MAG: T9SS type A sorting domain-containing protein [Candidatus Symbiothrix sp.]|jgi:hypothetical protein|nr:T9SS type A sorting domain-containing protein [Candidatus Symbiothrix sp.]
MKKHFILFNLFALFFIGTSNLYATEFKVTSKVNNETFGSISPVDTETAYDEGANITYTLTPADNCEILKLSVNGVDKTAEINEGVYSVTDLSEDLVIIASFRPAGQKYFLVMPPIPYPEMPGITNIPMTKELFDPVTHKISSYPVHIDDAAKFMTVRPGNNPDEIAASLHPEVAGQGKWHVIGYDICLLDGPETLKPGFYDLTYVWNDLDSTYYIQDEFKALFPFTVNVNVSESSWGTKDNCADCGDIYIHVKEDPERVYKMTPRQAEGWYSYTFEDEPTWVEIYFTHGIDGLGGEEQSESIAQIFSNRCLSVNADKTVVDVDCPPADAIFISTADELIEKLTANTNSEALFVLTDNLDLGAWIEEQSDNDIKTKGWKSLGTQNQPITGTIDGNGFFLYNIWSNRSTESSSGGFIARAKNLSLKNLGIKTKAGKALIGKDNFGGFVCDFENVQIEQCCFNGFVRGGKQGGAFLGYTATTGSYIKQSYAYGGVYGTDNIGGLWGKTTQKNSLIEECYALVTVNGKGGQGSAGGLLGSADMSGATVNDVVATVKNSFVLNDSIVGAWSVAPVCAYNQKSENVVVINSVQLDATIKQGAVKPSGINATHIRTKQQILSVDTVFTNRDWSFTDVWQFRNGDYPVPVLKKLNLDFQPDEMPHHLATTIIAMVSPEEQAIRVYPNPTGGRLFIQTTVPISVSVYDAAGRLVLSTLTGSEIDLSAYPAGIYLLKMENRYVKLIKI